MNASVRQIYAAKSVNQMSLYVISVFLAIFSAVFWCFFNFLAAEDAIVLFNRYNYLEGAPIFFYYAGYNSLFPQLLAFIFSAMNPAIQAALYSITAAAIFIALLREVFLVTRSGLIPLTLVSICAVFFPFVIYNLTYSFWTGLAILGLVGLRCCSQGDALKVRDILICLPGLAGSPLAIVFFPLFAWASLTSRSLYAIAICIGTITSFFALVEYGQARADAGNLLSRLISNAAPILGQPLQNLISFAGPGDLAMSAMGSLSLAVVIATGFWAAVHWRSRKIHVALYAIGSTLTVVAAISASSVPLAGRYWFPIIVCALTLIGHFWKLSVSNQAQRKADVIFATLLCTVVLTSFLLRFDKWGGSEIGLEEWRVLAKPPPSMTAIVRTWHGDGGLWAIGAGQGAVSYEECAGLWEHPDTFERFGFRIYCGMAAFR